MLVEEIVTLHGLEVQRRKVAYGNINAKEATAIFIRSALVEENLLPSRKRQSDEATPTAMTFAFSLRRGEEARVAAAISFSRAQPQHSRKNRELAHARSAIMTSVMSTRRWRVLRAAHHRKRFFAFTS